MKNQNDDEARQPDPIGPVATPGRPQSGLRTLVLAGVLLSGTAAGGLQKLGHGVMDTGTFPSISL